MTAPARVAAYQALRLVATADLGDALVRTRDPLEDSRDRALATDLVTGTLRWRGAIDYQLARLSGISAPALSLIETGKRDLRVTSLCRIADALRVAPGDLVEDRPAGATRVSKRKGYDLGDYT